jgi:hypothetical protein
MCISSQCERCQANSEQDACRITYESRIWNEERRDLNKIRIRIRITLSSGLTLYITNTQKELHAGALSKASVHSLGGSIPDRVDEETGPDADAAVEDQCMPPGFMHDRYMHDCISTTANSGEHLRDDEHIEGCRHNGSKALESMQQKNVNSKSMVIFNRTLRSEVQSEKDALHATMTSTFVPSTGASTLNLTGTTNRLCLCIHCERWGGFAVTHHVSLGPGFNPSRAISKIHFFVPSFADYGAVIVDSRP